VRFFAHYYVKGESIFFYSVNVYSVFHCLDILSRLPGFLLNLIYFSNLYFEKIFHPSRSSCVLHSAIVPS
jgi:hypothetical protein